MFASRRTIVDMTRRPRSDSESSGAPGGRPAVLGAATRLLERMRAGDESARDQLAKVIYEDLCSKASAVLCQAGSDLVSTGDLVHEAWERLDAQDRVPNNRAHYLALAARMMRRVLLDLIRRAHAQMRGGDVPHVRLSETLPERSRLDVLAVDEALSDLQELDERQAKVVEMRFFGGMTHVEIAQGARSRSAHRRQRLAHRSGLAAEPARLR